MKIELPCPCCGDKCHIQVDVSDGESCQCCGCGDEFPLSRIRDLWAAWSPFLAWLDAHPSKAVPEPETKPRTMCEQCDGKGRVAGDRCWRCRGTGVVD